MRIELTSVLICVYSDDEHELSKTECDILEQMLGSFVRMGGLDGCKTVGDAKKVLREAGAEMYKLDAFREAVSRAS